MRRPWEILLSTGLGLALAAPLVAAWLALEPAPRVTPRDEVSVQDVARAVALLRAHDPRRLPDGTPRVVTLHGRDVELLLNHAAHRALPARVSVQLERGAATVRASAPVSAGLWLNLRLELAEQAGMPAVQSLEVGRLPLPALLAGPLLERLVRRHPLGAEIVAAAELVNGVRFDPGRLGVAYAWSRVAGQRVIASFVPLDEQLRLRAYTEALAATLLARPASETVALGALMPPLFALARQRTDSGQDAAAENRAALLVLTLHAAGRTLAKWVPAARDWPVPPPRRVTLAGREDLPLHFLISAGLAVDTTSPLSRAVGLYKEVADARSGSGFSFSDLAADRAGTRFGERLTGRARTMQDRLAGPGALDEGGLMPAWSDLPEFMPEADFRRRFGGVGAPAYNALLADIDGRIESLALLR
jgi:hypothetical protein